MRRSFAVEKYRASLRASLTAAFHYGKARANMPEAIPALFIFVGLKGYKAHDEA